MKSGLKNQISFRKIGAFCYGEIVRTRVSVSITADRKSRRLLKIKKKDFEMKKSSRINL